MSEPTPEPTPSPEPTPQPEPAPAPTNYLDDEGKFTQEFRDSLPDDLGKHSVFDKYGNFTEMVKGSINGQKLVNQRAADFWKSDDPAIVAERASIMGLPSDVKDYSINTGEVPEGLPVDEQRIEALRQFAFEQKIPQEYVQKLYDWDMQNASQAMTAAQEQQQASLQEAQDELRKEWPGDKYQYNVDKAVETLDFLGLGHLKEDPAYGNNPAFIKAVVDKIVPAIDNDTLIEARQAESFATLTDTQNDLLKKMREYQGNTSDVVYQKMVKQNAELLEKLAKQKN
jgi:hypothetical protein